MADAKSGVHFRFLTRARLGTEKNKKNIWPQSHTHTTHTHTHIIHKKSAYIFCFIHQLNFIEAGDKTNFFLVQKYIVYSSVICSTLRSNETVCVYLNQRMLRCMSCVPGYSVHRRVQTLRTAKEDPEIRRESFRVNESSSNR